MRHTLSTGSMAALLTAVLLTVGLSGCDAIAPFIKVQGNITTSTTINGQTSTQTVTFDKLEDMPAAFSQATDHLSATTDQLIGEISKIASAPPPGEVVLSDLSPRLKRFEKGQVDFLHLAATDDKDPQTFKYVQIGVPTYDGFFKVTTELYAITFQGKQAIVRGKQLAFALLERDYDAKTAIAAILQEALNYEPPPGKETLRGQLIEGKDVLLVLADLGPAFVGKIQELIGAGQQLITAAPTSIMDPRTLLHVDLIIQGLEQSIVATTESGTILVELVEELVELIAG